MGHFQRINCPRGVIRPFFRPGSVHDNSRPNICEWNPRDLRGIIKPYRTSSDNLSRKFRYHRSKIFPRSLAEWDCFVSCSQYVWIFRSQAGSSLVSLRFLECINGAIVFFVSFSFSLRFCCEIRQVLFFLSVQKCLADSESLSSTWRSVSDLARRFVFTLNLDIILMSCIHYKFRSALEYDTITFDGLSISLADLKRSIITQKKFGKNSDFDLEVTNAQTKEGEVFFVHVVFFV